jgi:asparagine synthase (glutamine-hydrolysing)
MCGIAGLASFDGRAVDPAVLAAMNATLDHRGPDSSGQVIMGPVGLAARRLAIIDLTGGDQPISNEDGTIHVVQNGEIYNHVELRAALEAAGHRFATRSDTEVLVHLYEERGPAFVEALRGMFAIALWDGQTGRLVLGRDRFGIKPLYYRATGETLSWASELKALLKQPGFELDVDLDALEAYLAFNAIPGSQSIFRQVRKLPAGHLLVWDADRGAAGIDIRHYARPRPLHASAIRAEDEPTLASELRERLRDSVRAHLIADVPVGVLLSGGIDSSALVALAAEESSAPVRTFSIGFEERSFNELANARLVAQRYGTDHHELVVRPDAVELFPALVAAFDEPFGDSSALPTYLVSEMARRDVKVALSGEGGDELFGGYYTYVADQLATRVGRLAVAVRPLVERLPTSTEKVSFDYKAKRFVRAAHLPPLERHHAWKEIFSPAARAALLAPDRYGSTDPLTVYRQRYDESEGAQPLARLQDVDMAIYLVDGLLVKVDRASMAHSLETRVPFLDPVVAELALALPDAMKVRRFTQKRLLRRAVAPLVPQQVLKAKKQGFSIPAAAWFRGPLEPFARDVLSPSALAREGFFRPAPVARLIDRHTEGREDLSRQIWNLMAFTLWYERYARVATESLEGDALIPLAAAS